MPTYDYQCSECRKLSEEFRRMDERNLGGVCPCGGNLERVILAAPTVSPWDAERKFPNLRKEGDGTMSFPSRAAYEGYLKQEGIGELGIRAPIRRPHGNTVIGVWNRSGERLR